MTALPSRAPARRTTRLRRMARPALDPDPALNDLLWQVADRYSLFPRLAFEAARELSRTIGGWYLGREKELVERLEALEARVGALPQEMLEAERRAGPTPWIEVDPSRMRQHGGG